MYVLATLGIPSRLLLLAECAWEAELVTLKYEEIPKWNDQGFRVTCSRVDDKRCLKMVYFSFQKIQEESEEDATVNSDSITGGEETFVTEMVRASTCIYTVL